jgi:hypothetical protein
MTSGLGFVWRLLAVVSTSGSKCSLSRYLIHSRADVYRGYDDRPKVKESNAHTGSWSVDDRLVFRTCNQYTDISETVFRSASMAGSSDV